VLTGLVLGKFAPLHRGHCHVLDSARAQTDSLVVVIYDSPKVTNVPLKVRANWLRRLYPEAEVIEAWGGPSEVGLTAELKAKHEDFLLEILRDRNITHFFSSEEYGEHVAARLVAEDIRVDMARMKHPISATAIRQDLFDNRAFLPDIVYRDLIRKVVFLGAPSSGKSTITELAASDFGTNFMPEYGRTYWEENQIDRRLTPEELVSIAVGHREREDQLVLNSKDVLFIDTDATTTKIFGEYYHQDALPELKRLASECADRYDITFLCLPDIPYDDTADRSGETNRAEFHARVLDALRASRRPFIPLGGSLETRLATVRRVLKDHNSYQNPYEWSPHA